MLKHWFEKLDCRSSEEFFSEMTHSLERGKRQFVITANPEVLTLAEANEQLARALSCEDCVIVADGIGVVRAAESLGKSMHGRVPGVELATHLLEVCSKTGRGVYLYGATEQTMVALKERIARDFPGLVLLGAKNGYDYDDDAVFDEVVALSPDVVLVALGAMRQETLIYRHLSRFDKGILVGVGGSFDVLSGRLRRAPRLFVKLNLEWLWRILRQPRRFARFFRSNTRFLRRVRQLKKQSTDLK